MHLGRTRITGLMGLVVVAAVEFWAVRVANDWQFDYYIRGNELASRMIGLALLGALPIANILGIGLLISLRGRGNRPFLLGFEVAGFASLLTLVAAIIFAPELLSKSLVDNFRRNVVPLFLHGPYMYPTGLAALTSIAVAVLTLPQVAFALLGGLLVRKFRKPDRPVGP